MPLAKCIRRCFDSQLTRRYWPGDQDEMAEDHVFIKTGCFVFVDPAKQKEVAVVEPSSQPLPELKNPENTKRRGNPNWIKKNN